MINKTKGYLILTAIFLFFIGIGFGIGFGTGKATKPVTMSGEELGIKLQEFVTRARQVCDGRPLDVGVTFYKPGFNDYQILCKI